VAREPERRGSRPVQDVSAAGVYDLILAPGGGLLPDGTLPVWAQARFDRALEIRQNEPILCLSAGTPHKPPPVDASGRPVFEAAAGARYLLARGLHPNSILTETASRDTIGNAFFARVIHTDVRGWRSLLIVNSAFHMQRTEAVFRWVFSMAPDLGYRLAFDAVPDAMVPAPDLEHRRRRELAALSRVEELRARIHTLSDLHSFLFTEHGAYSAAGLSRPREPMSEEFLHLY
jgi:uncharacterized SAM-binding protein YcdF (DUF218 family)